MPGTKKKEILWKYDLDSWLADKVRPCIQARRGRSDIGEPFSRSRLASLFARRSCCKSEVLVRPRGCICIVEIIFECIGLSNLEAREEELPSPSQTMKFKRT